MRYKNSHRSDRFKLVIHTLTEIATFNTKITKARELLLEGNIEADDFRTIKTQAEIQIVKLEAKLAEHLGKKDEAIHKTLVSDSVSKAKWLKLTHRIEHNQLMYRLLETEHLVYFKKQSYVCFTLIVR